MKIKIIWSIKFKKSKLILINKIMIRIKKILINLKLIKLLIQNTNLKFEIIIYYLNYNNINCDKNYYYILIKNIFIIIIIISQI